MDAKEARRNVNAVANIVLAVALIAATIISAVAIVQQPWFWWQMGLALCGLVFLWGVVLVVTAQSIID